MNTALEQLEHWITQYKRINGTPPINEVLTQIDLLKDYEKEQCNIDLVSKRYHFEWENENNETQNFYYSATNEETAMNEFYSHYPNAKMVMVSWKLNVC